MVLVFTGLIQHVGRVTAAGATPAGRRLCVDVGPLAGRLALGGSLAVDGACLTVCGLDGALAAFDVVGETLARTTLGGLRPGMPVNLETPLAAGDPIGGHIVQGHVDGVAEVLRIETGPARHTLRLAAPPALTDEMVAKGSVALAGVSLTLTDVAGGRFSVALIPATLACTTLGAVRISDRLNVESDIIGKYVARHLKIAGGGLTVRKLREEGFA